MIPSTIRPTKSIFAKFENLSFSYFFEYFLSIETAVQPINLLNSIEGRDEFEEKVNFDELSFEQLVIEHKSYHEKNPKIKKEIATFECLKARILNDEYIMEEWITYLDGLVIADSK